MRQQHPKTKIEALKKLDKLKADLYNKWLGTFMEPTLRAEIEALSQYISTI